MYRGFFYAVDDRESSIIGGIKAIIGQDAARRNVPMRDTARSKVVSWARKKTGIAVRAEEDEEEEEIVEVAACGCVGPYRTEVKAKARRGREEASAERREKTRRGRARKRKKDEILLGAINPRR